MTGSDRDRSDRRQSAAGPFALRPRTGATAFAVVVFVGSVLPVPTAPPGGGTDGAIGRVVGGVAGALPVGLTAPFHFLGYAVLAALLVRATGRERRVVAFGVATAATTAFGLGIELVQAPVPWRSFVWSDVAVNAAGAVVGAGTSALRRFRSAERGGR